eukprot:7759980-Heterocapsa_arctica.AAC.1
MKIVVSGRHAPIHKVKSLCVVTLSSEGGEGRQSMMRSRGSIGMGENRTMIVVDMNEEEELEFIKIIGKLPQDM